MKPVTAFIVLLSATFVLSAGADQYVSKADKALLAELEIRKQLSEQKQNDRKIPLQSFQVSDQTTVSTPSSSPVVNKGWSGANPQGENIRIISSGRVDSGASSKVRRQAYYGKSVPSRYVKHSVSPVEQQSIQSMFKNMDWGTPSYRPSYRPQRRYADQEYGTNNLLNYYLARRLANTGARNLYEMGLKPSSNSAVRPLYQRFLPLTAGSGIQASVRSSYQHANLMSLGGSTLGTIGGQQVNINTIGGSTLGTIGGQNVNLNRVGGSTLGTIGGQQVNINTIGGSTLGTIGGQNVNLNRVGGSTLGTIGGQQVNARIIGAGSTYGINDGQMPYIYSNASDLVRMRDNKTIGSDLVRIRNNK